MADYKPHPALANDINAIIDHYLEQGSPDTASRVISTIFEMIDSLVPTAVRHRGHRRYDLTDRPLLFVNVYDYLVAYVPDEEPMYVIAILHGRRDPKILSSLLGERH